MSTPSRPSSTPPTVTEGIHSAYREMFEAITACARDESRDEQAPGFIAEASIQLPDGAPLSSAEFFFSAAKFVMASVGVRVRQHIGALALTYASVDPGPHWHGEEFGPYERWPGGAAFTLARSVLEGVATACWLTQPAPDAQEVIRRAALVEMWSAFQHDRSGQSPLMLEDTLALVRGAGLGVQTASGRPPGIRAGNGKIEKFSHTAAIRAVFGPGGLSLYTEFSGRAHHAPWAERGRMRAEPQERESGSGLSFRASMEQQNHVALAANVSLIVARYINDLANFYGRDKGALGLVDLATDLQAIAVRMQRAS